MRARSARVQRTLTTLFTAFSTEPFRYDDALTLGITPEQLRSVVKAQVVGRLHRGWYFVAHQEPLLPRAALTHARQLADRGIPSVIGGTGPASLWGVYAPKPTQPPLLLIDPRYGIRPGMRGGVLIRHSLLPPDHVITFGDVQVTSALRTGIDCARGTDPLRAFLAVNSAVRRSLDPTPLWTPGADVDRAGSPHLDTLPQPNGGLPAHDLTRIASDPERMAQAIDACKRVLEECTGHGLAVVRSVLRLLDPRLETALESLSWWRFDEYGLDLPTPQKWVRGASGLWYRVDFEFDAVIGEADGLVKYQDAESLSAEKERQADIELTGTPLVRWTWQAMWHRPATVIAALRTRAA